MRPETVVTASGVKINAKPVVGERFTLDGITWHIFKVGADKSAWCTPVTIRTTQLSELRFYTGDDKEEWESPNTVADNFTRRHVHDITRCFGYLSGTLGYIVGRSICSDFDAFFDREVAMQCDGIPDLIAIDEMGTRHVISWICAITNDRKVMAMINDQNNTDLLSKQTMNIFEINAVPFEAYVRPFACINLDYFESADDDFCVDGSVRIGGVKFSIGQTVWLPVRSDFGEISSNLAMDAVQGWLKPQRYRLCEVSVKSTRNVPSIRICLEPIPICDDRDVKTIKLNLGDNKHEHIRAFHTAEDCELFIHQAKKNPRVPKSTLSNLSSDELIWIIEHPECTVYDDKKG